MTENRLPKEDYQALLDYCVEFAEKMLREQGGFLPFGASILLNGQLVTAGADSGEEHPLPSDLIDILVEAYKNEAATGKIKACCICFDSAFTDGTAAQKTDAIAIDVEHQNWEPMRLSIPYTIDTTGKLSSGNVLAGPLVSKIFPVTDYGSKN